MIRNLRGLLGVAIGEVSNEVDQIMERYNAGIGSRRGRLHEQLALRLVLPKLCVEVFFVGARSVSIELSLLSAIGLRTVDLFGSCIEGWA